MAWYQHHNGSAWTDEHDDEHLFGPASPTTSFGTVLARDRSPPGSPWQRREGRKKPREGREGTPCIGGGAYGNGYAQGYGVYHGGYGYGGYDRARWPTTSWASWNSPCSSTAEPCSPIKDPEHVEACLASVGVSRNLQPLTAEFDRAPVRGSDSLFCTSRGWPMTRPPLVTWDDNMADRGVLMMYNADASEGPCMHWLLSDVVGGHSKYGIEQITYKMPQVSTFGEDNRVIILLFHQPAGYVVYLPDVSRSCWPLEAFLDKNPELEPVAMNYFMCSA